MNKVFVFATGLVSSLVLTTPALAHVVVKPAEVGVASFQTFTIGVPSEKEIATTGLRLVFPEGLKNVHPNVKSGWRVNVTHEEGNEEVVKEISWIGGSIPGHFRDDFLFSAQAPAAATTLQWKAYQTYSDGSVVEWDRDPTMEQPKTAEGAPDFSKFGPYSVTQVIDDVTPVGPETTNDNQKANNAFWLAAVAVFLSAVSLFTRFVGKR